MRHSIRRFGVLLTLLCAFCTFVGCDREVMEVETPAGELEVEEEFDGGMEVEIKD